MRSFFPLVVAALAFLGCRSTEHKASPASADEGDGSVSAITSNPDSPSTFTIKGSDAMLVLSQRWADVFMKGNPTVTIQVTGGGVGAGIAALIDGTADICQANRPMTAKEKEDILAKRGAPALETRVALDALAVYVNQKNPVQEISIPAVHNIYSGEIKNWRNVGGPDHAISLYGRENNSGTYGFFKEYVLENRDFAASVRTLTGAPAVVGAVNSDPFAIGYGAIASVEAIRMLKVKKDDSSPAVGLSRETVREGSYPLARYVYFDTAGEPTGVMKRFIAWVHGPAGQQFVGEAGYYSVPRRRDHDGS